MEPIKPAIGTTIEVDASHILGFDCGSRSWIEAEVAAYGPGPRDMIVGVGIMGRGGGPYVAQYTIDYVTDSHGCSWRIPIWDPSRRAEIAKAMSKKLLAEDGISVEGIERTEPDNEWWEGWLREADGVLTYLKEGRAQKIPK
jgi:hypothetical protein